MRIHVQPRSFLFLLLCASHPLFAGEAAERSATRCLILTGHQFPGHDWRATTGVLRAALEQDPRLQIDVSTDIEDLARRDLKRYAALVLNYCNWEQPQGLSAASRRAFVSYLEAGGGLTIVHFSNGAWHVSLPRAGASDWPEFRRICRRVWDAESDSGHDPYGPFTARMTAHQHPITAGMADFDTTDELYFNQKGAEAIDALVDAPSRVSGRREPLAWAYSYGAGRVFQTVLGHDAASLRHGGVAELVRRGTVWAAGKEQHAIARRPISPEDSPPHLVSWKTTSIDPAFRSEGVAVADVNRDGSLDILAGQFWYEAPRWTRHEIAPPEDYGDGAKGYASSFLCFADDINNDGWDDYLVIGFPGEACHWHENPRGGAGHWKRHLVWHSACNESPHYADLFGDGDRVLIMAWKPEGEGAAGRMSWFRPSSDPTRPWQENPISGAPEEGKKVPGTERYSHGLGVGDLNEDGRNDVLCTGGWWEQPAALSAAPWRFHPADLGEACSHMVVVDVDGDGLKDVISSSAHRYGIWWHRHVPGSRGARFETNDLFKNLVSQTHALRFRDVNGDGLEDIITGKRWWAHGPTGDPGSNEAAVLYWFEARRGDEGRMRFIPHLIHDASGVGLEFDVVDMDGNGTLDIVTSNKKGTFLFQQESSREAP